jgi:hypothetical protein
VAGAAHPLNHNAGTGLNRMVYGGMKCKWYAVLTREENAAANSSWGPWKSESAEECVTTHLSNEPALKMDGAQACNQSPLASLLRRKLSPCDKWS